MRLFDREQEQFIAGIAPRLTAATKAEDHGEDQRIKDLLDEFDSLIAPVAHELDAVYREAGREAREGLEARDSITLMKINEAAFEFARARSAELVGRKWVDGKLVDNPDAKWAITDTTRDMLRALSSRAFEEGMTPAKLQNAIESSGVFSEARARMIARTEMARSQIQGSLGTARAIGVIGKSSEVSNDHDHDDECDDAQEDGVIALTDDFSNGSDGPPFHPNCNCALVFYTADDAEAAELVPAGGAEEA